MSEGALFDRSNLNLEGAIQAWAQLHFAYLFGLQFRVSFQVSAADVERRMLTAKKFLGFEKLGLTGLPDACAKYHVLSTVSVGSTSNICRNRTKRHGCDSVSALDVFRPGAVRGAGWGEPWIS